MVTLADVELELMEWTVESYHRLIETGILTTEHQVELLNGQIIEMSPAGRMHAACIDRLNELLRTALKKESIIRIQSPITLVGSQSEPEPDISILKRKANYYADAHPTAEDIFLVIEVSDSTLDKDRHFKMQLYAVAGIAEYWLVNLNDQQIEQHLEPVDGSYQKVHIIKGKATLESNLTQPIKASQILP